MEHDELLRRVAELIQEHAHSDGATEVMDSARWVVLEGGPPGLAPVHRLPDGTATDCPRLVVAYYGQHQHFDRTDDLRDKDGRRVAVFRWTYRTAIAE
jgi:hypothetical protein